VKATSKPGKQMQLAAHQPLFLPPPEFFWKMSQVDIFLLADQLQYSTHGNFNRGKIKTVNGPVWLTVPVRSKGKSGQPIRAVEIDNHTNWQKQHLRTLFINYRNAPYFEQYRDQLEKLYLRPWATLGDFSTALISFFQAQLFIKTQIVRLSQLNLSGTTNEMLISALRQLNCAQYVVEASLRPFVDEPLFHAAGLEVHFIHFAQLQYYQQFSGFEPGLSVLDLLLNEGEMSFRFFRA
jgi:hypothetical protein